VSVIVEVEGKWGYGIWWKQVSVSARSPAKTLTFISISPHLLSLFNDPSDTFRHALASTIAVRSLNYDCRPVTAKWIAVHNENGKCTMDDFRDRNKGKDKDAVLLKSPYKALLAVLDEWGKE
jgi:hypothetical protein